MAKSFERELHEKFEKDVGMVLIYDYKEPLMRIPKKDGYGYWGVQEFNTKTGKALCKVRGCGKWFTSLGGHVSVHNMSAREYKIKWGLMQGTSLNSPALSRRKSAIQNAKREELLHPHIPTNKGNHNGKIGLGQRTIENRNKRGTCQAQLIAWKRQHPNISQGNAPSEIRTAARYLVGGWDKLTEMAKVLPLRRKYNEAKALKGLRDFYEIHKRPPTVGDARLGLLPYGKTAYETHFGSWTKALAKVGLTPRAYGIAQYDDYIIRAYCNNQKSLKRIGKELHCSCNGVKYRLETNHIPLRPSKKAIQENDKLEETNEQTGHNGG